MGGIIQETIREHYRSTVVIDLQLENWQLREQLGFAIREIHPAERRCEGLGQHALGPVFYGIDRGTRIKNWIGTGKRTYRLVCPDCYEHYIANKED